MSNTFIQDIRQKAAKKFLRVAFPNAKDVKTLKAALTLKEKKIAEPWLVGNPAAIEKIAKDNGLAVGTIPIIIEDDPAHAEAVQRAFLNYGLKTEIRVAGTPQGGVG